MSTQTFQTASDNYPTLEWQSTTISADASLEDVKTPTSGKSLQIFHIIVSCETYGKIQLKMETELISTIYINSKSPLSIPLSNNPITLDADNSLTVTNVGNGITEVTILYREIEV